MTSGVGIIGRITIPTRRKRGPGSTLNILLTGRGEQHITKNTIESTARKSERGGPRDIIKKKEGGEE